MHLFPGKQACILSSLDRTNDGLLTEVQDTKEGEATLALINRMLRDINNGDYATARRAHANAGMKNVLWWGPTGIGATIRLTVISDQHQQHRSEHRMKAASSTALICASGKGIMAGFWPNLSLKPTGGYLGMPPFHDYADMRVVDIYRRDGDKLAENWVFIDLLHFLHMQGHDILSQI